jgi:hypothetical protein
MKETKDDEEFEKVPMLHELSPLHSHRIPTTETAESE